MLKIIFYVLFILPLMFQVVFGRKAIMQSIRLKLWQIALISLAGQFAVAFVNSYLISIFIEKAGTHDGLPFVGVWVINAVAAALILLVVVFQAIMHYQRLKN